MKLSFYGAALEVTGSNYLLETDKASVVIDCGAFQGGKDTELKNAAPFMYDPKKVDAVVVTHAHLDHVGRVAKLVKDGFRGTIWATPPTIELMDLVMHDAASIMSHEEMKFGKEPFYSIEDVDRAMAHTQTILYNQKVSIADGVEINLVDAGHILGSASVELWADGRKFLFSGDIGNIGAPIIKDPVTITEADYVICESTYGGRTHEPMAESKKFIDEVIDSSVAKNGVLLIPSFALERTQNLLYDIHLLLEQKKISSVPIFLDSPLAIKATEVFTRYPEYFDEEAIKHVKAGEDFLNVPGLKETISVEESKAINSIPSPKIVIAGSGMMTGGRIKFHLKEYIDQPSTTLFIISYQAQGTLGRRLLDGTKRIDLFGKEYDVKAKVVARGSFSAHADHPQLMDWLKAVKSPRQLFFTHGDPEASAALQEAAKQEINADIIRPRFGQTVELS